MKQILFFLCFLFNVTAYGQLVINGDVKDWGDSLKSFDKENKMKYEIRSDNVNLYIAIYKNDNAMKAFIQGGVQLNFDSVKISDRSFRVIFGHRFSDPEINSKRRDFFEAQNFLGKSSQVLPIYNEYGITPVFNYKNDTSNMPSGETINAKDITKNLSIYQAEIVIPLIYLPKKNGVIQYSICLRGYDLEKKGEQYYRSSGLIQDSSFINEKERNEMKYFTEHFGNFKLSNN